MFRGRGNFRRGFGRNRGSFRGRGGSFKFQGKNNHRTQNSTKSRAELDLLQKKYAAGFLTGGRSKEIITEILQQASEGIYLRELIEIFSRTSSDRIETKKNLNKALYDLKAKGIANRSDSNPPLWKLIKNIQQTDSFQITPITMLDPPQEYSNTMHLLTSPNSSLSKESVICILQANTNGVAGKDIVNKLNNNEVSRLDTKKQVNKILYELQSQGTVIRSDTNPPIWTLTPAGSQLPAIDTQNLFSSQDSFFKSEIMNGASEESIMQTIEMSPNGIVGKDIINKFATRANRLQTKKFINTILYRLQRQGKIVRSESNPPVWSIQKHFEDIEEFKSSLVTKETVVELLKSNPNGMFGRDIINVYCKNPSSRLQCKKHINKILYELQSFGMVTRGSDNPPKWALISESPMFVEQTSESSSFVIPDNIDELKTSLHTGNSKAAINEILSQNIQGVFGKDLVNMFTSDPTNRLEIKKLVNTILYQMQGEGIIARSESNPPLWYHVANGVPSSNNQTTLTYPDNVNQYKQDFASGDGKQAVIEIIKKNPTGVYLKDLVNIFLLNPENQLETKKKLNKILYELKSVGMVTRSVNNPPVWLIVPENQLPIIKPDLDSSFVTPTNIEQLKEEFISGSSKSTVIEILKVNDNGISGKNIINMLMKDTITRLDTKKTVNKVLYEMQSQGGAVRSSCNPPTWILASNPLAQTAQYLPNNPPINESEEDVANEIFQFIKQNENGYYLQELINVFGKALTFNSSEAKKTINKILYQLQQRGSVHRTVTNPPVWCLSNFLLFERQSENSEKVAMSSFSGQVASILLGKEKPLSMNDINEVVKNNGTSTDLSIHELLKIWEENKLCEHVNETDLWALTDYGTEILTRPLPYFHNHVFQYLFYMFANEEEQIISCSKVLEILNKYKLIEAISETDIENGIEFLLQIGWIKSGDKLHYEISFEGKIVYTRMLNNKYFNFVHVLNAKSSENFLSLLQVLQDNKEGKTLSHILQSNELWTRQKILHGLYSLRQVGLVEKAGSSTNLNEIIWKITENGYNQLLLQNLLPEDDDQSKIDRKHKDNTVAVISSISRISQLIISTSAVRSVTSYWTGNCLNLQQIEKVLLDLNELKVIERVEEDSTHKWKLSPHHHHSTTFKKKVSTSSKLPPNPVTPLKPLVEVDDLLAQNEQFISTLQRLNALVQKCRVSLNRIGALNEWSQQSRVKIVFNQCDSIGSAHCKTFMCTCEIEGRKFCEGRGSSKKEAKNQAAFRATEILISYYDKHNVKMVI